jgi:transposase-like protein
MARPLVYSIEQIRRAYRVSGESIGATARQLGCTPETVRRRLAEDGRKPAGPAPTMSGPEATIEVMRVDVGLSGLVDARVVFVDGAGFGPVRVER